MANDRNDQGGLLTSRGESVKRAMEQLLGAEVESVSLIGHAVGEGLGKGELEEAVVVLKGGLLDAAERIGAASRRLKRERIGPPLLMTSQYIQRSLDAFPVEYLYMQHLHHTVVGVDPFEGLRFERASVRLQCEREAKRYLLLLRQGLMRGRGDAGALREVLHELVASVVPLANAALFLRGVERPRTRAGLMGELSRELRISVRPLEDALKDLTGRIRIPGGRLIAVLRESYASLEALSEWLDRVSP
jgi:hypothetical protein